MKKQMNKNSTHNTLCYIPNEIAKKLILKHSLTNDSNSIKKFFKFETAFYDYLDNHVFKSKGSLRKCKLYDFTLHVHRLEPSLRNFVGDLEKRYQDWLKYKDTMPISGAAIISEDTSHVVMVQSAGCNKPWGFPKGKLDINEDPIECAIREVKEEIGFDIKDRIKKDYYIDNSASTFKKSFRLYIIEGIPMNTKFTNQCKGEIGAIEWKAIDELMSKDAKIKLNASSRSLIDEFKNVKEKIITSKKA